MPKRLLRVPTTRPGEPVARIAVWRTGSTSAAGPIIVFVHGAFSNAEAWRYVTGALGDRYAIWLVDLPGCGSSDKPEPCEMSNKGYGPGPLGERLYQALEQLLSRERPDRRVVLVGHSLGATIIMRMMADPRLCEQYAPVRERVAGLVLITPLDVGIEKPVPSLEYVAHANDLEVFLGLALGIIREEMTQAVREEFSDPDVAPREEVDRGMRIVADARSRHAMQAMILQATPRQGHQARPDWPKVDRLVAHYRNIDVPVQIICGAHDETLPDSMSYKLACLIPGASLVILPNCMHSPHLEQPRICAHIIRWFISTVLGPVRGRPAGSARSGNGTDRINNARRWESVPLRPTGSAGTPRRNP